MSFWSRVRTRFIRNIKEDTLAFTILWGTVAAFIIVLKVVVTVGLS